jgi:hypothetical protein
MWPFSKRKQRNKQQLVPSPKPKITTEELAENLIAKADDFLANSSLSNFDSLTKRAGADLAVHLRSMAIELSFNRQTEFSPDIPKLHLLAAKIAYLSLQGWSKEIEIYEKDVFYYRAFSSSASIVAEYESFKLAFKYRES